MGASTCCTAGHMSIAATLHVPSQHHGVSATVPKQCIACADCNQAPPCCSYHRCHNRLTDPKFAQVAEQGRDDIVYRSGRVRAPNETNGKACNLNNTLHWLYPAEKCVSDEEVGSIPVC